MATVRNFDVMYGKFNVPPTKKINKSYCYFYGSVGKATATGYAAGELGFDFQQGQEIFLFTVESTTDPEPTQLLIQRVPRACSSRVKRQGREADHTPPSNVEVKNAWSYTSATNTSSWRDA
jgi:hypothetical protein